MDWIYKIDDPLLETVGGAILVFIIIIVVTRIVGLRSFAKFTNYDFAITITVGSIMSTVLTSSTSVAHGGVAILALLVLTWAVSSIQKKSDLLDRTISNQPVLLMQGDQILYDNLSATQVREDQLIAKLREANVLRLEQVRAVVLESTGDISVLHASDDDEQIDRKLLQGVAER